MCELRHRGKMITFLGEITDNYVGFMSVQCGEDPYSLLVGKILIYRPTSLRHL